LAQALADEFHCPVYFCREMRDILEHPDRYRMPCLTPNAIHSVRPMDDGATQRWNEFELTYSYFPGQTIYHGGLVAKNDNGQAVFFVGDSFTPTGMDDYCLLNRNFLAPEKGFLHCLNTIRKMTGDYVLINQHVPPAFRFSPKQIDFMIETFEHRHKLLADLFPWDDPNYGVDEQWARFYPYRSSVKANDKVELKVIILNHSPKLREYVIKPHLPEGWRAADTEYKLKVGGRETAEVAIPITVGGAGIGVITADIVNAKWEAKEWLEAIIDVR